MPKNLVIVESPAKAKTIGNYLGKDYEVKSSFGHIRDLPSKGMSVDIENNFEPVYEISEDKQKVVNELKRAAKKADTVWLASDEDREGEAIAWHLVEAMGLKSDETKRIVFHEITKPAIENAIKNPRPIDKKLVDAQQARRVLDRLVGYELSPVLWKKIQRGLSAGRVQSVAVRLIVEREREIKEFASEFSFKTTAKFLTADKQVIEAELDDKPDRAEDAEKVLNACAEAKFSVKRVATAPGVRNPSAPFTTSTLQQEASRRLGFSVRQTMTLAQRLYEAGHITYMRTDSTNLAGVAMNAIKKLISEKYGADKHQVRKFKTKVSGAQEAHEAIRPTNISKLSAGGDERQKKLYELIWQRTVASQMVPAKILKTTIDVGAKELDGTFTAKGEIIESPGWMEAFPQNYKESILPKVSEGDGLELEEAQARQTFARPPARYTEASLVRKLEELGIGRPSTYAPTISTIQNREYVVKGSSEGETRQVAVLSLKDGKVESKKEEEKHGANKNKLVPTDIALVVNDFLVKNFTNVMDYDFTANVEGQFDAVAEGKVEWQKVIDDFYGEFHKLIKQVEDVKREEAGGQRELGKDPKDGKPVIARIGRYGPMLQKGSTSDEKNKPQFAPLPEGATLESVTLEEALVMFKLPRSVGKTPEGEEIVAGIGRYGPYLRVDGKFTSIKDHDPLKITEAEARKVLAEKKKEADNRIIKEFKKQGLTVLNGRYGPYVTDGNKNAKVPKDTKPGDISLEEAKELIANAPERKKKSKRKK